MTEEVVSGAPAEGSDEEAMREQGINLADKGAASKNETSVETSDGVTNDRRTPRAVRRHLPDERCGITHKFSVGGQDQNLEGGLHSFRFDGFVRYGCVLGTAIWRSAQSSLREV
jgi:hypothetical protein